MLSLWNRQFFSANIITRMKRGSYISLESIERICRAMRCDADDILEFIPDESNGVNKQ
jgi:putative transcriptional regulator